MSRELALIVGVGEATGQALSTAWAERYELVLVARTASFIQQLADSLPHAHAFACDVSDRTAWAATLQQIKTTLGTPTRVLINTESAAWGKYNELSLEQLSMSFDVNVISLLQLVQCLFPDEADIAADTRIMISSSPAAYTPPPHFLGLAPSRVAQRVLAELLQANLRSYGLSFCVFSINGAIDEPKMRAVYKDQPTSFFIQPGDIAAQMAATFEQPEFPAQTEIRGASAFA